MRTVLHNNSATNHWRPCKRGLYISLLNLPATTLTTLDRFTEVRLPKFGQTIALVLLVAKKELRESIENCTATAIAELAQKGIE